MIKVSKPTFLNNIVPKLTCGGNFLGERKNL